MRFIILLAIFSLFLNISYSAFINSVYTSRLAGEQVVPPFSEDSNNLGAGVCIYFRNENPPYLACFVENTYDLSVATISSVGIYNAARGFNGANMLYSFLPSTIQTNFNILSVNLTDLSGYTIAQQENDYLNGLWYIQINSNSTGSIRGQLEHSDRIYSVLDYRFAVPAPLSSDAHGVALGVYSPTSPKRLLQFEIIHDVTNPTGIEVRAGTFGVVGPFVFSLVDFTSPIFQDIEITIDEENLMYGDYLYMTVPSVQNVDGDIRGQITTIDYLPRAKFTSRINNFLTSVSTPTDAKGCAIWVYRCETSTLEYFVFHNVTNPTQAVIYNGVPGINGTALFTLSRAVSPIYGSIILSQGYEELLFNESLFINIESTSFPEGEIVGPVNTEYPYYAYLSGTNVVPPVSTAAIGCATFQLVDNLTLSFDIEFSVLNTYEIRIMEGFDGVNGIVTYVFENTTSPLIGELNITTNSINKLVNNLLYIEVTSEAYPIDGELRGQIHQINTTCAVGSQVAPFIFSNPPTPPFTIFIGSASTLSISLSFLLILVAIIANL